MVTKWGRVQDINIVFDGIVFTMNNRSKYSEKVIFFNFQNGQEAMGSFAGD